MNHLLPSSLPEIFVSVAIIGAAITITVLALAVTLPPLYQEMKTWLPRRKVIDLHARRRELGRIAAHGVPHKRGR